MYVMNYYQVKVKMDIYMKSFEKIYIYGWN